MKVSKNTLDILFDSRLKVKILKFLFRNPISSFNVRELAKHVQDQPRAVRKEIAKLAGIGLVKIKK